MRLRKMNAAQRADLRDLNRITGQIAKRSNAVAIAALGGGMVAALATKLPEGKAYGCNELNRRRPGAMQMNFWRGSGFGG